MPEGYVIEYCTMYASSKYYLECYFCGKKSFFKV